MRLLQTHFLSMKNITYLLLLTQIVFNVTPYLQYELNYLYNLHQFVLFNVNINSKTKLI